MKKKITIIIAILFVICSAAAIIGILNQKDEPITPPKELKATLESIYKGHDLTIETAENSKEVRDYINGEDYYIILDENDYREKPMLVDDIDTPSSYCNEIEIYLENYKEYYIKDEKKSEIYDNIYKFSSDDDCKYLILENYEKEIKIYNIKKDTITSLDITKIRNIEDLTKNTEDLDLFIFQGHEDKYGLVDPTGKIIIEPKYNMIRVIENDKYLVKLNKEYGIIDSKENVLVNIVYTGLNFTDNYYITLLDNNLYVLDKEYNSLLKEPIKTTLKYNYEYSNEYTAEFGDRETAYSVAEKNNNLYIKIYNKNHNKNKMYLINKDGIIKTLDKNLSYSFDDDEITPLYFYFIDETKNNLKYSIYDDDFNEIVLFNKEKDFDEYYIYGSYHDEYGYFIELQQIYNNTEKNEYYDLVGNTLLEKNLKTITLDNGYKLRIIDNKLTVFNSDKILLEEIGNFKYHGYNWLTKDNELFELKFTYE